MHEIQLQLDIGAESLQDKKLLAMQSQIQLMNESFGKVRRKLFAEMNEIKKLYLQMKQENRELREQLRAIGHPSTQWTYSVGESLFEVAS